MMEWTPGLQGVFTLADSDQSLLLVDQGQPSQNYILSTGDGRGDGLYDFSNLQTPADNRILFMDEHGNLHQAYQDLGFLANNLTLEDDEIPSHALDHMYAKKPREPGTEQTSKPRRRAKKKEPVVEPQFIIEDAEPITPKINIIRQRLPSSVYKSLSPSRPKILQGASPTKLTAGSLSPSSSSIRKDMPSKIFSPTRISTHKDDPSLTPQTAYSNFGDETKTNNLHKSLGFGSISKSAKDEQALRKIAKPFVSKVNSNSILMDELHKQEGETEYEEEMLFDFGIAEDEDEVNRCTLSSEEFNDAVFGECEFEGSLEPYAMTSQNIKGLTSSRLPNPASHRFYKKTGLSAAATLGSGMSDDDDSNQIMVPMGNRRKSSEWNVIGKIDDVMDVKVEVDPKDFNSKSDKIDNPLELSLDDMKPSLTVPQNQLSLPQSIEPVVAKVGSGQLTVNDCRNKKPTSNTFIESQDPNQLLRESIESVVALASSGQTSNAKCPNKKPANNASIQSQEPNQLLEESIESAVAPATSGQLAIDESPCRNKKPANDTSALIGQFAVDECPNKKPTINTSIESQEPKEKLPEVKNKRTISTSSSNSKSPVNSKPTPEPTRRSVRATRAPARLEDNGIEIINSKRRRR